VHPTAPPNADAVSLDRPLPMLEFMFETTRSVTDMVFAGVMARFSGIRFVIPHCGAALPVLTSRIELFRSIMPGPDGGPAGAATTEDQLRSCWFDVAGFTFPHHAPAAARLVGEDRLVYGSDYCWTPAPSVAQLARDLDAAAPPISAPDWRTLLRRNADRLLG
jgi:6-methylsalicylate decarboxylase